MVKVSSVINPDVNVLCSPCKRATEWCHPSDGIAASFPYE